MLLIQSLQRSIRSTHAKCNYWQVCIEQWIKSIHFNQMEIVRFRATKHTVHKVVEYTTSKFDNTLEDIRMPHAQDREAAGSSWPPLLRQQLSFSLNCFICSYWHNAGATDDPHPLREKQLARAPLTRLLLRQHRKRLTSGLHLHHSPLLRSYHQNLG